MAEEYDNHSPYNYVGDNPIKRIDPNGEDWWDIIKGAAVAVADNMTQGALDNRRRTSYNSASDYNTGQDAGDIISAGIGALMTIDGAKNVAVGTVVTVGSGGTASLVSVPAAVVGSAEVVLGVNTLRNSITNFASKKGRVTEEKAQNLEKSRDKGVPDSQIDPSGKPKVHNVAKENNKRAMDAARNNPKSNTKPVKHSSDSGQKTHYHSTRDGEKQSGKDNIHYEDKSTKRNK